MIKGVTIFEDYWIHAKTLRQHKAKCLYLESVLEYLFYGIETENFKDVPISIRNKIILSQKRSESGRKGGRNSGLSRSKIEASVKQNRSKSFRKGKSPRTPKEMGDFGHSHPQSPKGGDACAKTSPKGNSFNIPTAEEVKAHAQAVGFPNLDAEEFVAYYEARGWKLNGEPMKSWKACVVTWKKNHARGVLAKQPDEPRKPNICLPPKGDMSEYLPK